MCNLFGSSSILLFSKDLITVMISFISLFVSVSPETIKSDEGLVLVLLSTKWYDASKRVFGMLLPSARFIVIELSNASPSAGPIILLKMGINPPGSTILDNGALNNFVLANQLFAKD